MTKLEKFKSSLSNRRLIFWGIIAMLLLIIAGIKSYKEGMDANVYLYASSQFYQGEDIYNNNPFNLYLYSPFFAALLGPFTLFGDFGRSLWGITNMILFFRLAYVFYELLAKRLKIDNKLRNSWVFGTLLVSFGMVLHNVSLGQITIFIMWLTLEGLYQALIQQKKTLGGILIGAGVVIKIIPLLALFYLAAKKEFKASLISSITIVGLLILPGLYVGFENNNTLLKNWENTINPSEKYIFEFDNGTYSLNAIVAAYFFDFEANDVEVPTQRPRQIVPLSNGTLSNVLLSLRIVLALGIFFVVFYKKQENTNHVRMTWEFAYLCLATALIFPHQQKYAMLYFVPAGSYFLMYFIQGIKYKLNKRLFLQVMSGISMLIVLLFTVQGRDIIGNEATEFFDDYHTFGLINLVAVPILMILRPEHLLLSKE